MKIVNTDEFWKAMKSIYFVRHSANQGSIRGEIIYCDRPPETIEGYIEGAIAKTLDNLGH